MQAKILDLLVRSIMILVEASLQYILIMYSFVVLIIFSIYFSISTNIEREIYINFYYRLFQKPVFLVIWRQTCEKICLTRNRG